MIVIGLDIGTTSICGVALEVPEGRLLKAITLPNRSSFALSGGTEEGQRPDEIVHTVNRIVHELVELFPHAAGMGVTGQMHGIVYTNAQGEAVSPLYTWQDQRGLLTTSDGETVAERLTRMTGYPVSTGYGLVTHYALMEQSAVPEQATHLCTISDYVVMQLVNGSAPIMEASNAASIGLFHTERGQFDEGALRLAGINSKLLPAVLPSVFSVGQTKKGITVFNAIGDNQASVLGSLRNLHSSILLNVGTGGQLTAYSKDYITVAGLETRPFPGGGYLLVGASLAGGKSYAMLEGLFRSIVEAFTVSNSTAATSLYSKMEELLDHAWPSEDKLIVQTQFYGTRLKPELRGSITNIGPANLTPQHLIAGFIEGMAEELYGFYSRMPDELRRKFQTVTGSGNGIRSNRHLRRLCVERFAMPIQLPPFREEASVGAALHAAVGLGAVDGHTSAGSLLPLY